VGVVHLVISRLTPRARVIDITHGVPRHDVRAGALTLWRAAPVMAPGVILGVVDPGVGTDRRNVAIQVAAATATFVGPDNGLLVPAALSLGPITAAVALPPASGSPGRTFDGRDVFGPAAARLATGAPIDELGLAIDPATLRGDRFEPARPDPNGVIDATVTWVDHFGNAQLDVDAPLLPSRFRLRTGEHDLTVRVVGAFGELDSRAGELGLVVDSYGFLAITLYRDSAARLLKLRAGDRVVLAPAG
jgi:S-adenosylmethionine hydrolase